MDINSKLPDLVMRLDNNVIDACILESREELEECNGEDCEYPQYDFTSITDMDMSIIEDLVNSLLLSLNPDDMDSHIDNICYNQPMANGDDFENFLVHELSTVLLNQIDNIVDSVNSDLSLRGSREKYVVLNSFVKDENIFIRVGEPT